MTWNEKQI